MIKRENILYEIRKNRTLFLMALPAVLYFLVFAYLPMAGGIVAFKDFHYNMGIFGSPWLGFDNFKFFFMSGNAFTVTRNTIMYNLFFITTCHLLAIVVAIILSEMSGKYFKKMFQSFMFLPYFISWVIVGVFVYNIFNYEYGVINTILKSLGKEAYDVYGNPGIWKYILIIFNSWKWVGYSSVMYLAAIMGIDAECFEAADIDGANVFQKIFHITLPSIIPTIVVLLLLQVGRIMRGDFEMFYQIIGNNGQLYNATDVIDTFVFRSLLNSQDIGMAAAAGLYQSVLGFIIIIIVNKMVKKIQSDYALF